MRSNRNEKTNRKHARKGHNKEKRKSLGVSLRLVKKKSGETRLCIDFRKLNSVTKKNVFPLPNLEDCLDALNGNKYFSTLDLASGYWQIEMAEKSKELTAFRTETGHYEFERMPFGLCNAPASFQKLVNALFTGLNGIHLQVFMDDICLATKDWSSHLELLSEVFRLLREANLKLKPTKCTFGSNKVIFLGHELSEKGIRQDPNKFVAIQNLPAPRDLTELKRVLGLFGYYRRFVPNYSILAEPMTRLLKKNTKFSWQAEQESAMKLLKESLKKNQALAHYNYKDPVAVRTDASGIGIAAILLQRQDGEWNLISCCSRRLTPAESNYAISELEALAIVYALHKWRNYLLGIKFTILTDHCALCALKSKKLNSPRLHRWALLLSEFDFQIKYVKGNLRKDVDCLSRAPVNDDNDKYIQEALMAINIDKHLDHLKPMKVIAIANPIDAREWKQLIEQDEEAKPHIEKAKKRVKGYNLYNGLLYFEKRLFVPKPKRSAILRETHADPPANHAGVRATLEQMKHLWWPNMVDDAKKLIESCTVCQA